MLRRLFEQQRGRRANFAARREPLQQAREHEQQRCGEAICAKVGATAIVAVPSAISSSVRIIAFLRPARSAYMPITAPPSGRVTKPTPKLATASINCPNGECTGKNSLPIRMAKKL